MKQLTIETPYHVDSVHLYLAEIGDDLVLFDTGPPLEDAKKFLREQVDLSRLRYVFVTHGHIDHYGMADFLQQESDAQVLLPRHAIRQLSGGSEYTRKLTNIFLGLGFPADSVQQLITRFDKVSKQAALPEHFLVAEDSVDILKSLDVGYVSCPWHSQGDLVYTHKEYALLGDVALRGLFPVPIMDVDFACPNNGRFDNYSAFCTTIERLKELKGKVFLPAHNQYFDDLDNWICFVVTKIVNRAARLLNQYRTGKTVYQTVVSLFGEQSTDPLMVFLKTSEVVFMFDFLRDQERLREVMQKHQLYERVEACFRKIQT